MDSYDWIIEILRAIKRLISPDNAALFGPCVVSARAYYGAMMRFLSCLVVFFASCAAYSQPTSNTIETFVAQQVDLSEPHPGLRVQIKVGELDSRLKLRPCKDITPFVPPGTRLWGRAYVGMRCNEARGWTVFVPVDVQIFALVPVAARALAAGETVEAQDVVTEERDITRLGAQPVTHIAQLEGRVLMRGFAPGQPLVMNAFRTQPVVASGDPVKVIVQGGGFLVSTSGTALAQAEAGQAVRIRLENGRMLQGIAQPGRIVEVKL